MVQLNDSAPDFSLPSTSGKATTLKQLRGKKVVLYFYPKDDTPGCTMESCDFRDNFARLTSSKAVVLGVSKDSIASHEKFRAKYSLPFELLTDANNALAKSYGAYGKKMLYGKSVEGTVRSTFLIDEKGKIAAVWSPVKVDGHVDAVLQAIGGGAPVKTTEAVKKPAAKKSSPAKVATAKSPTARMPAGKTSAAKASKTAAVKKAAPKKTTRSFAKK